MSWKHHFKHVDRSESLENYIESQFEKVDYFLLKEGQWHVYYSFDQHRCCIEVSGGNGTGHFKAKALSDDFYVAADLLIDKLSKQFRRKKEKVKNHKKFHKSKEGQLDFINERMEYVPTPNPFRKPA